MSKIIDKHIGETPLEALERFRADRNLGDVSMTYAGRLDPMAEGKLLILIGEECKDKEKYLGLDKEYEVEIVFGIETDTYDALGLVIEVKPMHDVEFRSIHDLTEKWLQKYVGKFSQAYPPYSSKTVKGKQLHELARSGDLPEEMPTKEVEIYSIELLETGKIGADELLDRILKNIDLVTGDFRQQAIKDKWKEVLGKKLSIADDQNDGISINDVGVVIGNLVHQIPELAFIKIRVKCSSGTYMRSLAHRLGNDLKSVAGKEVGAFAMGIRRTKIFQLG